MKACPHEDYTSMFTAYTTRKKSKCPSVDTWINKLAYLSEGILLSNKKSEPLIHTRGCVSRYYIEQKKPNMKKLNSVWHRLWNSTTTRTNLRWQKQICRLSAVVAGELTAGGSFWGRQHCFISWFVGLVLNQVYSFVKTHPFAKTDAFHYM